MAFNVDRFSLKAPGMSGSEGQDLVRDIAGRLGGLTSPPDLARRIATLDVRLPGIAGESRGALARRAAAEIIRQLSRTR